MGVNMQAIKSLRSRTGAGINDCKKALEECGGDEEKAVDLIQAKGLAKVAKRAGAIAAEGTVHAYIHAGNRVGVLLEVNSQTDFVARTEDFTNFVKQLGMHIAAEKPLYVTADEIPQADIDRQNDIFKAQLDEEEKETGKKKPEAAVAGILSGKLAKWKKGVVLNDQEFILSDDKKTVGAICDELSAKIGEKIAIRRFVRYELGEGIEKKTENFAEEVAKQIG